MKTIREMIREGIKSGELSEEFIKEITQKHPEEGVSPTINGKPELMECTKCEGNTFKIKVTPHGTCGSDIEWICAKCEAEQGGIFNDPLGEIPLEIFGKQKVK